MLDFTIEKTGNTSVLTITEKAGRKRFYDFRETCMIFLGGIDHVIINISGLTGINLTGLQWLCSVCNTILSLHKSVALEKDWPNTFNRAVMDSGFVCRSDCLRGGNNNCILMEAGAKDLHAFINENNHNQWVTGLPR